MVNVVVEPQVDLGPLELWRHSVGHGGISPQPVPERVAQGMAVLRPRWLRIFIQEFFRIYPDHGRFDWSRLDPYMDRLASTGAKIVAAITIKPPPLYPRIDQDVWRPTDTGEWQAVIRALVRRYSVEKPIVTHWEIGNEPDIGEDGGCPYRITDPAAYAATYEMTTRAVLEAFPGAKVGGPAMAVMHHEPLRGLLRHCARTDTPLDFLSWHLYHSDPGRHGYLTSIARLLAEDAGLRPELFVTEWSAGFPAVSLAEDATDPRRAALVAAAILEMRQAGLDGSFYYHLWDQVCSAEDFAPFFSEAGTAAMVRHWNEIPHRFGLFSVEGEVRPPYFVFQMLSRVGETAVASRSDHPDIRVLAGRGPDGLSVLMVNHGLDANREDVATVRFAGLEPGPRRLTLTRIDRQCAWDDASLALIPIETRRITTLRDYMCQVRLPANSVAQLQLPTA